jgi:hypothetical protein
MGTHLARARTVGRRWYKPKTTIELRDAYQVVLFVFMHELFHLLVKRSRRNPRQKESMCDRFAARHLVNRFDCKVRDGHHRDLPRDEWDFQDLNRFVARAAMGAKATVRRCSTPAREVLASGGQRLLFPVDSFASR